MLNNISLEGNEAQANLAQIVLLSPLFWSFRGLLIFAGFCAGDMSVQMGREEDRERKIKKHIYCLWGLPLQHTLHFNFVIFNYQTQCPLTSWVHSMTNVLLVMVVVRRGASAACRDLQWSALQSPKDDHHLCHILWLMVVLMCRLDCLYYLHHFTSHFLVFSCWSGRLGKKVSWRRGEKKCIVNEWISAALIWFDLLNGQCSFLS